MLHDTWGIDYLGRLHLFAAFKTLLFSISRADASSLVGMILGSAFYAVVAKALVSFHCWHFTHILCDN